MLLFIAGTFTGSIFMLGIMSLMVAAKNGDEQLETYFHKKTS